MIFIVIVLGVINTFLLYCCIFVGKKADMMSVDFNDRQIIKKNERKNPVKDKEA